MRDEKLTSALRAIAEPLAQAKGLDIWGIECASAGKKRVIRIFIEGPDGVSIDQCAEISRSVGLAFDVEDVIPGAYTLEVSSPGFERPFFSAEQLAAYTGREVAISLHEPLDVPFPGRRKVTGNLVRVEDGDIVVEVDGEDVELTWGNVAGARLVHRFEKPARPGKPRER